MAGMTLRQLEYFVAAYETGTVRGAADLCYASPGAVSEALRDLEDGLGMQLMVRRRAKGTTLTQAGAQVLPIARRMLADAQEIVGVSSADRGQTTGPLAVGCSIGLGPRILPPLAVAFAKHYPAIDLTLLDGPAYDVQDMVITGAADAALAFIRQVIPGLESRTLRMVQIFVALSPDHRLARRTHLKLAELADEPLLRARPKGTRDRIGQLAAETGVTLREGGTFLSPETARAMVAQGLGYSITTGLPASPYPGKYPEDIRLIPITDLDAPAEVVLLTRPGQHDSARLRALDHILALPEVLAPLG